MDFGQFGTTPVPAVVQRAFGVDTTQEFSDLLGMTTFPGAHLVDDADAAYRSLRMGAPQPACLLLVRELGVRQDVADVALAMAPDLLSHTSLGHRH